MEKLTNREAKLIGILESKSPAPVRSQELIYRIWDGYCSRDAIYELIYRTNKKIAPREIKAQYGVGYRLVERL